ncbi:hypothetical protein MRS44_003846 [Fusarium solani]|uniref:uncharacterized protein n=1 Tax=Fusarium solani TaxID=169388 RepID=UPI0032C4633A|nr:hypothetical protein MRS44_003846 [Fusarium solani]
MIDYGNPDFLDYHEYDYYSTDNLTVFILVAFPSPGPLITRLSFHRNRFSNPHIEAAGPWTISIMLPTAPRDTNSLVPVIKGKIITYSPLLLSTATLILSNLALFAGQSKGALEDYAILRLDLSDLGPAMLSVAKGPGNNSLSSWIDETIGGIAEDTLEGLNIYDWYSVHVLRFCWGNLSLGDDGSSDAALTVSSCTGASRDQSLSFTRLLQQEFNHHPFDLGLGDLGWIDDIQAAIDLLSGALLALVALYGLAVTFCGLELAACIFALLLPEHKGVQVANFLFSTLGCLVISIGSCLVTTMAFKSMHKTNQAGEFLGVSAAVGENFLGVTWATAFMMLLLAAYWSIWTIGPAIKRRKLHSSQVLASQAPGESFVLQEQVQEQV